MVVIGTAVVTVAWPATVVAIVGGNVVVPPAATKINAMLVWFNLSTYGKTPAAVNLNNSLIIKSNQTHINQYLRDQMAPGRRMPLSNVGFVT